MRRAARLTLLAATLAVATACGSGSETDAREEALKGHLGPLRGARVSCEEDGCSVIGEMRLSSVYTATLVAAPVIEQVLEDPDLDGLESISVTLDDEAKQQVFSLRCETAELRPPVTVDSLRRVCHSIFT